MRPGIDRDSTVPYPTWWSDWPPLRWETAEHRQRSKVLAAQQLLSAAMNVTGTTRVHECIRSWTEPADYPGVLCTVAEAVLDQRWDGDVTSLNLRLVTAGYAARIGNGVLLSDLYWNCPLAGWEYAALVLLSIRSDEDRLASAMAVVNSIPR